MSSKELNEEVMIPFNFPIEDKSERIIKVIGVGGGGGNAVQHMWETGVKNVTFLVTNTDSQVLKPNQVPNKVQLGNGLGTGGKPELGREIAENSIEEIKTMFGEDTKMVLITAGMGGGTGTGAAPVIARVAKDMGLLTIGVVTLPFKMEGKKRIDKALKGLETMKQYVDSLIIINNEKLLEHEQYNNLTWEEGMKKADEVLTTATKTIAEIITVRGMVNRDFNDVNTVMKDGGTAIVSVAKASGEKRIFKAMSEAVNSPLIANINKQKTKRLLYIIYSGTQNPARIPELTEITEFMDDFSEDIEVLWGHYPDDTLGDEIKVSIVATGFDTEKDDEKKKHSEEQDLSKALREKYYGSTGSVTKKKEKVEQPLIHEVTEPMDNAVAEETAEAESSTIDIDDNPSAPAPTIFRRMIDKLNKLVEE